jgi:hypothetical protein
MEKTAPDNKELETLNPCGISNGIFMKVQFATSMAR